jgi:HPt (histidine-containing phosphotransfer) domain-containing protein
MTDALDDTEEFDESRFKALLELAGPSMARTLTIQLQEDLALVAEALTEARASADHRVFRKQSHVLLGIAGTIGAVRLYELSQRLNNLTRDQGGSILADLLAEIFAVLDRLLARIRSAHAQLAAMP